jgi:Gram-negative bacterial TonB protein C-terminal
MLKCFLKRFVPFVLALKVGILLVWLVSFFGLTSRDADSSFPLKTKHSRTWLIIRDVPAPEYTEREARAKGAIKPLRLRAMLDVNGLVTDIKLLSTASKEFAEDAMDAARLIKFIPASKDGYSQPLWVDVVYGCSGDDFGHRHRFQCDARIVEVEKDWRTIYE